MELVLGFLLAKSEHFYLKHSVTTKICHSDEGGISAAIFHKVIPIFSELLSEIPPSSE